MAQQPTLGPDLMNQVRAAFIQRGTTITAWCRENGVDVRAARQTIYGTWDGPKGRALRARILKAAGLSGRAAA